MAGSVAKVIDTATMVQYMKSGMPVKERTYGQSAEFSRATRRQDFTKANLVTKEVRFYTYFLCH